MRVHLESLEQMRTFAAALAEHLRAGDLLILTGNLGAGKTTFTQSLGKALDVAGRITSPTFVIAREHLSRTGGPALVHVDAYRLADGGARRPRPDSELTSRSRSSNGAPAWPSS